MSDETNIYLMRHAQAVPEEENPVQPLSERGREQVRAMAAFLQARGGLEVERVWHSPLARARETAELLCDRLGIQATCRDVDGLLPYDDHRGIARRLSGFGYPLLVVGHDPHLGRLTSMLVCGNVDQEIVSFKRGAILCLERERTKSQTILWRIRWYLTPALISEETPAADEGEA